ncbi:MAG: hypothetical protein IJP58_02080 [Clostridia bacterium]|nr:hypothetical protein [Clostridia bacterium]
MILKMNNASLNEGGGNIENKTVYKIGNAEYNVDRVFGETPLKIILMDKISGDTSVENADFPCYTDVEVK